MKKIYLSEAADSEFAEAIQQFPKAQPQYDETYRHFILHKFPYHLIYFETEDFILVDAVANAYRDRDYWRQ